MADGFGYVVREAKQLGVKTSDNKNLREETYRLTVQASKSLLKTYKPKTGQVMTLDTVINDEENRYTAKRRTGSIPFYNKCTKLALYGEEVKDQDRDGKEDREGTWRLYLKLDEEVEDKKEKRVSSGNRHRQQRQRPQEDNNGDGQGEGIVFVSVTGRKILNKECKHVDSSGKPCAINSKCWEEVNDTHELYDKSAITLLEGSTPMVLFGSKCCLDGCPFYPRAFTAVVTVSRWTGGTKVVSTLPLQFQQLLSERKCFQQQLQIKEGFTGSWLKDKDLKIKCSDGEVVEAHREVLMARSSVFAAMLSVSGEKDHLERPSFAEGDENKIEIKDVSSEGMEVIIGFIYTGSLQKRWKKCAQEVVGAADKYGLLDLLSILDCVLPNACTTGNALELQRLAGLHGLEKAKARIDKYLSKNLRHVYKEQTRRGTKRPLMSDRKAREILKRMKQEVPSDDEDRLPTPVPTDDEETETDYEFGYFSDY